MDSLFLKPSEVAPLLGVSTNRIYQLVAEKRLPAVHWGRHIRIPRKAWDAWCETQCAQADVQMVHEEADGGVPMR